MRHLITPLSIYLDAIVIRITTVDIRLEFMGLSRRGLSIQLQRLYLLLLIDYKNLALRTDIQSGKTSDIALFNYFYKFEFQRFTIRIQSFFPFINNLYALYRSGVTRRVFELRRVRGGFLGRVETLRSNPPQLATGRVRAGRNPRTRPEITLDQRYNYLLEIFRLLNFQD